MRVACRLLLVLAVLVLRPGGASAQAVEGVGTRALGMGGAFVAVADDASATYWNPAGLATAALFSLVLDTNRAGYDDQPVPDGRGAPSGTRADLRRSGTLLAFGVPPLGGTVYRLTTRSARVSSAGPVPPPAGTLAELSVLRTTHAGVNLLQTVLPGVHVGTTLKYVRGTAAHGGVAPAPDDPLDAAGDLRTRTSQAFDLDAGLMVDLRRVRLGLTMRNGLEPDFATPDGARLELPRLFRSGVAVFPTDSLIVSVDADLTSTPDPAGPRRSLAAGVEQQLWNKRLAIRGGVSLSTRGDVRPAVSAGSSVSLRSGLFADGYIAVGLGDAAPGGVGVGLRFVY
ncbi:MAG: conjugal transfer protein TraF [Luteitalea sp.]